MIGLLWLSACLFGPQEVPPLVDLTLVATKLVPATPLVGEPVELEVWLSNPEGLELELMVWTCVPGESGCLEAELGLSPAERVQPLVVDGPVSRAELVVPWIPEDLWGDETQVRVVVWTLACEVGECPRIDEHERLDAPLSWDDMPSFGKAALGFRPVYLRRAEHQWPNRNPRLYAVQVQGDWVDVPLFDPDDDDNVELRGVTTSGSFVPDYGGGWWTGSGPGELFLVANDHDDGIDVVRVTRQ